MSKAVKYRWDMNRGKGDWLLYRTITVPQKEIDMAIARSLEIGPQPDFYKYDLYNESGESDGMILSTDANLFD